MNKHLVRGLLVGGLFAAVITWVAAADTLAAGGFALVASSVFGLAAGICIGGLVAANFAMLAYETKAAETPNLERAAAPAHALPHTAG